MEQRTLFTRPLVALLLVLAMATALHAPGVRASDAEPSVSVDELIELKRLGFTDAAIREEVAATTARYDLREPDIERLRKAGFDDAFIDYLQQREARPPLDNAGVGRMLKDGLSLTEILQKISSSEPEFDGSPRALLEFSRRFKPPTWLLRVMKGGPLTISEIRALTAEGVAVQNQLLLIDILGAEPSRPTDQQMLALLKAGVPGDVVRRLREGSATSITAGDLPGPGYYPHPLGLFTLRYPSSWHLIKEIDGDSVSYAVTPAAVTRLDDLEVGVQVSILPVDPESVVADMTPDEALEQVLPVIREQEPGLAAEGTIRSARLGQLPAATQRLTGTVSDRAGRFTGELTLGFRDGLMAMVISMTPAGQADAFDKPFGEILTRSSFLDRLPPDRPERPIATQQAVASHRASVVSITSYRDDTPLSTGTGFIIRDDGYVLTNHHVIWDTEKGRPATRFTVEWDAELGLDRQEAKLIGYRRTSTYQGQLVPGLSSGVDVALLKLPETQTYQPFQLVSARNVQLGDPVLTLGFPARGMIQTLSTIVTSGIITRFNKDFTGKLESVFIDAPIAHGSSGGPTLNLMYDRVFGLNTFGSFGIRGVEDLWNYFGVIPIDYALTEFPLPTRLSSARDKQLDTPELYDAALLSQAEGAVPGAMAIAQRALKTAPTSPDAHYLAGRLRLEQAEDQDDVDAGLKDLQQALTLDQKHLPTLTFLARAHMELGNPDQARSFADRAVAADPTDAEVYTTRALVNLGANAYDKALTDLGKAKQLTQKSVPAPYLLAGETYYAMKRYTEGRQEFEQAIKIQPTSLQAVMGTARYYTLTDQPVAALLEYSKIDRAMPGRPAVLAALGRAYDAVGKPDNALESYLSAIERSQKLALLPEPSVYLGGARAAQSQKVGKPGLAINLYIGLLASYWGQPPAFDGHVGIARVLMTEPSFRAIARGHLVWALAQQEGDPTASTLMRELGDARLSFDAIKAMVNQLGYPAIMAGLIVRETPLDFTVEPTQQSMDELQKVLPGEVALAIFLSQEKHRAGEAAGRAATSGATEPPASLVGRWQTRLSDDAGNYAGDLYLTLDRSRRYLIEIQRGYDAPRESGTYTVSGATLRLAADSGDVSDFEFQVRGNQLSLAGGAAGNFSLTRVQ
jgi:S1-C subfamily serine protease/tetratricopeptide (TPR) repeat protein